MNALALYRLTAVPEQQKSVAKPPLKRQRLAEPSVQSVKYICKNCGEFVYLSSEDTVQCNTCEYRIVTKLSTEKAKTYDCV